MSGRRTDDDSWDITHGVVATALTVARARAQEADADCPLYGSCAFLPMWRRAAEALAAVYDGTTFADLLEEDQRMRQGAPLNYVI